MTSPIGYQWEGLGVDSSFTYNQHSDWGNVGTYAIQKLQTSVATNVQNLHGFGTPVEERSGRASWEVSNYAMALRLILRLPPSYACCVGSST